MASTDAEQKRAYLAHQLRYETPFWAGGAIRDADGRWQLPAPGAFQGCAQILNKQRRRVHIVPNPWQLEFDDLLEKQRAEGKPMRGIVLKSRKLGFCCDPSTRVLTADLQWVELDDIKVGQEIVSTDELIPGGRGRGRKMRVGVVEGKREVREPAFRLCFDNGQSVIATAPHRWLCRRRGGTEADWRPVSKMQVGDYVRHVAEPWDHGDREDGWMGGLIDGEGSLAAKKHGGGSLTVCQRPSAVLDRARDYLRLRGYSFNEELEHRPDGTNKRAGETFLGRLSVHRMNELFRLIGQTGSTRFTEDRSWWAGRDLPGKRSGVAWAKLVSITPLGPCRMIDLQTDRKTFIAEGFVSHNSTWIAMKFIQRVTQMEYQQAIIVAQDVKTADQIFKMALLCHTHLPDVDELGVGFSIRPPIVKQNFSATGRSFVEFGEATKRLRANGRTGNSVFEIDTANAPEGGRGYTPSLLHLSEVAKWQGESASKKMLSSLNSVAYEPETIVVLESTANGMNHFYRRWINARDGAGDPDSGETYVALFVPWWRDGSAAMPFATVEDRARFVETIGDTGRYGEIVEDEPMLVEAYACSPEQLMWRRMMIKTQHESNVEMFRQEFPATDEEAFIGSGRTVFGSLLVTRAIKAAEEAPEPVVGSLRPVDMVERRSRAGTVQVPQRALWVPGDGMVAGDHELRVWEHPFRGVQAEQEAYARGELTEVQLESRLEQALTAEGEQPPGAYVVAADIASGEANTFTKGDYHAIQVFNHRTHEQVAVHESRMDIQHVPLWILTIALYYNVAWVAVEVQGPGIAVVDPLQKTYRYKRMYRRRRIDRATNLVDDRVGWSTDQVSKPVMEATLATALQDGTAGIRDPKTARQLSTYVITEKGKHEAQSGEHDDLILAAMIAARVMEVQSPPRAGKRRRSRHEPADPLTGY